MRPAITAVEEEILWELSQGGALNVTSLSEKIGKQEGCFLPPLKAMVRRGLVLRHPVEKPDGKRGRPRVMYSIKPEGMKALDSLMENRLVKWARVGVVFREKGK